MATFKVLHFDFGLGNWVMKASMKIWLNLIETSQSPRCIQDETIKETKLAPLKIPNLRQHIKKKKKNPTVQIKNGFDLTHNYLTFKTLWVLSLNEISQIDMSWTSHMQTKR